MPFGSCVGWGDSVFNMILKVSSNFLGLDIITAKGIEKKYWVVDIVEQQIFYQL